MVMQDELFHRGKGTRSRPAVVIVLLFAAGITAGYHLPSVNTFFLFILTCFFFLICIFTFRQKVSPFVFLGLLFLTGLTKYQYDAQLPGLGVLSDFSDPPRNVLVWGNVQDRPLLVDERIRFTLRTDSLTDGQRVYRMTADLIVNAVPDVRYDAKPVLLEYGDYVVVHGQVSIPSSRRNPYEPDLNRTLSLGNISALMYVRGYYNIERTDTTGSLFIRKIIVPIRVFIGNRIDSQIDGESAHFLRGLLLGDRSRIDRTVRDRFVSSGVIHILAVSGLHVGIVTAIFFSVLGLLRLNRTMKIVWTIAGLILFMYVTGAAPSVVRATIMASVVLIGILVQRRSDIYNSIAVAGLILLMFDTRELFKPSFQLSFAAVIAIISIYPLMRDFTARILPGVGRNRLINGGIQLFLVSTAAQLGTLPFTAIYFERISLIAFAANIIVIPAVGLIISFGFAMLIAGYFSEILGEYYAEVCRLLLDAVLHIVAFTGDLRFSSVELFGFSILHGMVFYTGLFMLCNLNRPRFFKAGFISLLVLLNIVLYTGLYGDDSGSVHTLRLTMIDVGQGDAILIEFPFGEIMLIDAGPKTISFDAGERTVVPFLKRHGIRRIDAAVISHAHADHFGGLSAVVREIKVARVYDSGQRSSNVWFHRLIAQLEEENIPLITVNAGDIIDGFTAARVYVLHPSPVFIEPPDHDKHWNVNNASLVLLVQYGEIRILLMGDAEGEAEGYIAYIYDDFLTAEVLKTGHHGSITSSTQRFIDLVDPGKAIISVGRMNRFNHPSEVIIRRLNQKGATVYRTDLQGALIVETCGRELSVKTVRPAR
jgi:competence protein ComEC